MSSIAELKEDKKQMEEYIAELEEDKKQMEEHYESVVMTDKELIAEFTKRFIVPQFYTREHIVERLEENGLVPDEDKVDELIENFKNVYTDVDEILDEYIDAVDFERKEEDEEDEEEECAECCNCGEDVSNDNGTGSLVGGEYWCKTCVEEEEDEDHVKTEAVGVLDESDDEDDEEVRCVCEDCFLEGRIMVSKKRAEYLKKNVITEYSCVVCGSVAADE